MFGVLKILLGSWSFRFVVCLEEDFMIMGLGGGPKKGKMRIQAFPVIFILHFFLYHWNTIVYRFLVFFSKDDDGRE